MAPVFCNSPAQNSPAAGGFHRATISSSQEEFIRLRRISLFVGMLCEKILSVLFDTAGAKKNVFAAQIKRREYFALCGGRGGLCRLSFRCWTSQKSSIRVASETLENITTFTRHHAFLEKAGENFS